MEQAIAYYRVSTQRQGASGLGLEAQRAAVEAHAGRAGLVIAGEYTEVETGTRKRRRVAIYQAIDEARRRGAVLLIAKLDRLARDVSFVSDLMKSGVRFEAMDLPQANNLTIHIFAALAEHEAELISKRTREALAAARRRGVKLGKPENWRPDIQAAGASANHTGAKLAYKPILNYAKMLREGGKSYREIAGQLNEDGYRTRRGDNFQAMTVYRILARGNGNGHELTAPAGV